MEFNAYSDNDDDSYASCFEHSNVYSLSVAFVEDYPMNDENNINDTKSVSVYTLYMVSNLEHKQLPGALMDRGANGRVAGSDVWIIAIAQRKVDITGVGDV